MASAVKDTDLGLKAFKREIERARTVFATVGVHDGHIAEYAAANEYGTDTIPSRPFMRTTFDENVGDLNQAIAIGMERVINGSTVYRELGLVGMRHQGQIQYTIKSRDFLPKLKEATIKAKHGSAKTLIDTGTMVNSVTYKVHK